MTLLDGVEKNVLIWLSCSLSTKRSWVQFPGLQGWLSPLYFCGFVKCGADRVLWHSCGFAVMNCSMMFCVYQCQLSTYGILADRLSQANEQSVWHKVGPCLNRWIDRAATWHRGWLWSSTMVVGGCPAPSLEGDKWCGTSCNVYPQLYCQQHCIHVAGNRLQFHSLCQ